MPFMLRNPWMFPLMGAGAGAGLGALGLGGGARRAARAIRARRAGASGLSEAAIPTAQGVTPGALGGGWAPGVGSAAASGGRLLRGLPNWLGPAIGAGASIIGSRLTDNPTANMPPQLIQLLEEAVRRAQYQAPLFNQTQDTMRAMLPTYAAGGPNANK